MSTVPVSPSRSSPLSDENSGQKPTMSSKNLDLSSFTYERPTRGRQPKAGLSTDKPTLAASTPARKRKTEVKEEEEADSSKPSIPVKRVKKEEEEEDASVPPSLTKKKSATAKPKAMIMDLEVAHPTPENWEKVYHLIEDMRRGFKAPVDTMGCDDKMSDEPVPKNRRFHGLISLMLSSQTKDPVTHAAVQNLRRNIPGGFTPENLVVAPDDIIIDCIKSVGFWRRKTEYIKEAAKVLVEKYDGEVPKTVKELCELRGVGPKMSMLAVQICWGLNEGIGVDTHVHRITNRLGWHNKPTLTPEQTRLNLQSWMPRELFAPFNPLFVGFGQVICQPIGPRCNECTVGKSGLCPSFKSGGTPHKRSPVKFSYPKLEISVENGDVKEEDYGLVSVKDEEVVVQMEGGETMVGEKEKVKVEVDIVDAVGKDTESKPL